jgi:23S rRNA pseudouridine1911/1915/1917 synthase
VEEEMIVLRVGDEGKDRRLDQFLADRTSFSRSYIQKLIKNEKVTVNGNTIQKASVPVCFADEIRVDVPELEQLEVLPENLELDILYEDSDILVVNKPKGMVVHPAAGHLNHTLVNGLLYYCQGHLSGINGVLRPGIVHRIDKDTTGALMVCKNDRAHQCLAEQLRVHSITRKYEAIVYHNFAEEDGTVDAPIGRHPIDRKKMAIVPEGQGKRAVTHYHVLSHLNHQFNHIQCQLETGRTHQIRVHMSHIQHPILGDTVYGPQPEKRYQNLEGQTLHARIIGFQHPRTNQYIEVEAPTPPYFVDLLRELERK